jgi:membrane protein DedA with SNARE-associated domain
MPPILSAAPSEEFGLTGLSAWVADTMAALGALGVGAMTFLETIFPPIPSEVVLPLAGLLSSQGSIDLVAAFVAATVGSLLGGQLLYEVARRIGVDRSVRLLALMPLVDRDDADAAQAWFYRHGRGAVFFGRLMPGVRSLISLPAGASGMPRGQFVLYTLLGSALWNALLIGAGFQLGEQWERVEGYTGYLNYVVYAAIGGALAWLVARRVLKHRAGRTDAARDAAADREAERAEAAARTAASPRRAARRR